MFVVGTAGHVDHGKSTLIERLTGIDPDRLSAEKARGMTIELGFAWLDLGDGNEVSIVDVPGARAVREDDVDGCSAVSIWCFWLWLVMKGRCRRRWNIWRSWDLLDGARWHCGDYEVGCCRFRLDRID